MNFNKCKTFQNIINSNYGAVNECLKIFHDRNLAKEDVYEDLYNGHCLRITNKKLDYYNQTYNPNPIISNFGKVLGLENPIYLKFVEYCDPFIYDKCCNCVSVSLYILDPNNYIYLSRFIFTIQQSILNLGKYLPHWIYRLYLDPSVFEAITAVKTKADTDAINNKEYLGLYEAYTNAIKNIASQPNCEIYLTICSEYTADINLAGKRRSSRFSGFYEKDVNINAPREADGIIDIVDCHNLRVFEDLPIATFAYNFISTPARNYYKLIAKYGDGNKNLIFTFSAGLIALKFKVRKEIFEQSVKNVLNNYKLSNTTNYQAMDEHFLIELFRPFSETKANGEVYKIKYLFGLLPMSNEDTDRGHILYYGDISTDIINGATNKLYSEIDLFSGDFLDALKNSVYKNDEILLNLAKYIEQINTPNINFVVSLFATRLITLYLIENNHNNFLSSAMKMYGNIFINLHPMMDILNITTDNTFLILDMGGRFDYSLLNFFNDVVTECRTKNSMFGGGYQTKLYNNYFGGGYQTKLYNNYYDKYGKYKSKYLALKNKLARQ